MENQSPFKDSRFLLAGFWSVFAASAFGYVLIKYGDNTEILTLVFGTISGTILGGIFGVYFNSSPDKKTTLPPGSTTVANASTTTVTSTPNEPENPSPLN